MPDYLEYVDSVGRVPRGAADIDFATRMQLLLVIKMVLDQGGRVVVKGFATPEEIEPLMDYELKVGGDGAGGLVLEVVSKTAGPPAG